MTSHERFCCILGILMVIEAVRFQVGSWATVAVGVALVVVGVVADVQIGHRRSSLALNRERSGSGQVGQS